MKKIYKFIALFISLAFPLTLMTPSNAEIQPFIVGGSTVASWNEYPYQVGLVLKTEANFENGAFEEQFCGGVAVSDKWILTAAHCVILTNPSNGTFTVIDKNTIGVIGGELKLSNYRTDDVKDVLQIAIHPAASLFDQGVGAGSNRYILTNNDIALLEIGGLPAGVVAITALGDLSKEIAGTASTITGWGRNDYNSELDDATFPDDLLFGGVSIASNQDCENTYGAIFIPGTQICAIGGATDSRVNVCSGDSGGPLVSNTPKSLLGLTSYGRVPCGGENPGVFTRVSAFLGWIYPLTDTANVAGRSSLSVSTASVVANNSSTATVTVGLKDFTGVNYTSGGANVAIRSDLGTVSAVSDNQNGTYTATIRSSSAGTANITATVNGTNLTTTTTLSFTSPPPPPPPPPSSGGGAPAPPPAAAAPVVPAPEPGVRVAGQRWTVTTNASGVTRMQATVGAQFRGKNAVFFKRLKNGRLIRVGTGRIGRLGRANLNTNVRFREGQKIRVQVDGRFRSTVTIRN
jgi:secreted trypsin-like serine protease